MKKIKNLKILSLCIVTFMLASCGGGDDCSRPDFNDAVAAAVSDFTTAQMIFINDPTTENCENFRQAYKDYIQSLKTWEDCAIIFGDDNFAADLEEAEREADDFEC